VFSRCLALALFIQLTTFTRPGLSAVANSRNVIFSHNQIAVRTRFLGVCGVRGKCSYLLPIRRTEYSVTEAEEFATYFQALRAAGCEVIVIDGSRPAVFNAHAALWGPICRHQQVDRHFTYLNDKVNAVHTGIAIAANEKIILADDDMRYFAEEIALICQRLENFDVVRPQTFIEPLPWWSRVETARMLINRATLRMADYPGTCAFRRSAALRAGDYDGDVLFDNEEMIRHFARRGLAIDHQIDFFVRRNPARFRKWLEQRPRQAYEDFGLRGKTFFFASLLPLAMFFAFARQNRALMFFAMVLALGSILVAAAGRARGEAAQVFPQSTCWFAPVWILERAVSTYVAFCWYLVRGGYPFGDRILSRGIGRDWFVGGKIASAGWSGR